MCKLSNADIAIEVLDCWIKVHGRTAPNEHKATELVNQLEACSAKYPDVFERFDALDPEEMTVIVSYIGLALSFDTEEALLRRKLKDPPA